MLKMRSSSSDGGGTLSCGGWSPAISAFHFPISACIYFGRLGPFFKISKTIFSAVHASNANIPYAKLITKTCSTTWDSSRTCKPKTVQMASHSLHNWYERRDKWLAIWTVFGLHVLLLYHVVEHVFVINLVYGMLAFDALTAEKIAFEKGAEPSKKIGPRWEKAEIAGDCGGGGRGTGGRTTISF